MMNLDPVLTLLDALGVRYALIGGHALAARGFPRFTVDVDLLTTDARVLDSGTWLPLERAGASVERRRGDHDDPLAGVVHVLLADGTDVDLVVGRWPWEADVVARADVMAIGPSTRLPVVTAGDLVLLKLAAGGTLDLRDAGLLLEGDDRAAIIRHVDAHIGEVRPDVRELWQQLSKSRG